MPKVHSALTEKNYNGLRLHGQLRNADGSPWTGAIYIVCENTGIWQGVIFSSTPVSLPLDQNGFFSILLPPSVDQHGRPLAGVYRLYTRPKRISYSFEIPFGLSQISLSSLSSLSSSSL